MTTPEHVPETLANEIRAGLLRFSLWDIIWRASVRHCIERSRAVARHIVVLSHDDIIEDTAIVSNAANPIALLSLREASWLTDDLQSALDNKSLEEATPMFLTSEEYTVLRSTIVERNIR